MLSYYSLGITKNTTTGLLACRRMKAKTPRSKNAIKCVVPPSKKEKTPSFRQRVLNVGEGNAVKNAVTHGVFVPVGVVLV